MNRIRLREFALRKTTVLQARVGFEMLASQAIGRLPSKAVRLSLARKLLGLDIHRSAHIYKWTELRIPQQIHIGMGSIIGSDSILDGRSGIYIGSNVNLSSEVALWTLQHDPQSESFSTRGGSITIEDRAWISFRATILPGVTIGEGAVVAAGAIVTKNVDPFTIVGGIPAKPIGTRNRNLTYKWSNSSRSAAWFI